MHITYVFFYDSSSTPSSYGFGRGGHTSYHGGRGRGRHGNMQCQICFEFGHIVTNCYHVIHTFMNLFLMSL